MEKNYWEERWQAKNTGWDIGYPSTPLKEYIDQLTDHTLRILIPGCGNAYEAQYLWEEGFENTYIVEISESAIDSFLERYPDFPRDHVFHGDFFELSEKAFDLILEQTFFCAIHPSQRSAYAEKMQGLLRSNGKLVGLLFDFPLESGPPFGGSEAEYRSYFEPYFEIEIMERAYNSIKPREGKELFFQLKKK